MIALLLALAVEVGPQPGKLVCSGNPPVCRWYDAGEKPVPMISLALADRMAGHFFRVGIGSASDLFTTSWALHECRPVTLADGRVRSCAEMNPGGWDAESRIALKLALATFTLAWDWLLEKWGHSGLAKLLSWSFLAESGGFAVSNTRHALEGR